MIEINAKMCNNIADAFNRKQAYEDKIEKIIHNICELCKEEAEKGEYSMYLPSRDKLGLDQESHEYVAKLLKENRGFELFFDEWEDAYYVSWKNA